MFHADHFRSISFDSNPQQIGAAELLVISLFSPFISKYLFFFDFLHQFWSHVLFKATFIIIVYFNYNIIYYITYDLLPNVVQVYIYFL
jgi:hypothetical protein